MQDSRADREELSRKIGEHFTKMNTREWKWEWYWKPLLQIGAGTILTMAVFAGLLMAVTCG